MLQLNNCQKEALAKICDALAIASFIGFGASFAGHNGLSGFLRTALFTLANALVIAGLLIRKGEDHVV